MRGHLSGLYLSLARLTHSSCVIIFDLLSILRRGIFRGAAYTVNLYLSKKYSNFNESTQPLTIMHEFVGPRATKLSVRRPLSGGASPTGRRQLERTVGQPAY